MYFYILDLWNSIDRLIMPSPVSIILILTILRYKANKPKITFWNTIMSISHMSTMMCFNDTMVVLRDYKEASLV